MLADNSLVLYKKGPAIVQTTTDRIEILLEDGTEVRVRPKDVTLLHPGPLKSFADLAAGDGEVAEAWEVLTGTTTSLRELAELCFGGWTPATAWAAWRAVADGIYFSGEPEAVVALPAEEAERRLAARRAEAEEKAARVRFLERARAKAVAAEDVRYIREIEDVALGRVSRSRLLKDLARPDSPEGAHELLLDLGAWTTANNPHPVRARAETAASALPWNPPVPNGDRRDLTGMPAFAVDDEGTTTPDDAVSFDGACLWVHIADPAPFIPLGSALDADACRRGETLHLPERIVHMLPAAAIADLGLGLRDVSPVLSVRLELDAEGNARAAEIVPAQARITRLTYEEADRRIAEEPFASIVRVVSAFRAARESRGAFTLDLPEARITAAEDGRVAIAPLGRTRSRWMVQEAMVMTGQAVARWAAERGVPIPFSVQEGSAAAAELAGANAGLSQLWAARRTLRRSSRTLSPGKHAGLGVEPYCQVTSPLRRYVDLLGHHQIRAALAGREPLPPEETFRRVGEVEAVIPALRQAEIMSERHWTLVYLLQNPGWSGEAVVVDQRARNLTVVVPSLALEAEVHTRRPVEPDGSVTLRVQEVRLPLLEAHFSVV